MSEPIPESVPTSSDNRSQRPTKKRALNTPLSQQSAQVEALFAYPDREIAIPAGPLARLVAAPPEIVTNVQGSSAGAGSGEFHVYKASRRREYERLRVMDEEVEKEKKDREWEEKKAELAKKDEDKLGKNRAKREKAKLRKMKAKEKSGEDDSGMDGNGVVKKRLGPAKVAVTRKNEIDKDGEAMDGLMVEEEAGITIHEDD